MDSKPWYLSKTIWASAVAALCAGLALLGHNVDAGTQQVLVNNLTTVVNAIAILAPVIAGIARAKATTVLTPTKEPTP